MPKAINDEMGTSVFSSSPAPTMTKVPTINENQSIETTYGLTTEEILDVNAIKVTISDPSPIVILFGAKTSGKTMTLVRLTRYLRAQGYRVEPDRVFRSANSGVYQEMCDKFDETITNDKAAGGTSVIGFMLVTVRDKNGRPICQILEAPGEHYFDDKERNKPFPRYIHEILAMSNRRTWVFIVERNWQPGVDSESIRKAYAEKIISMQDLIPSSDKIIFTCHKADLSRDLFRSGKPIVKQVYNDIKNQYPGIFARYTNHNPITSLWKPYKFDFVTFSSGIFNKLQDGGQSYTPSQDFYPAGLWEKIKKAVMGSWF